MGRVRKRPQVEKREGWLMKKSTLRLYVALGRILPVVCLAAGGYNVGGSGRGGKERLLEKSSLGFVVTQGSVPHISDTICVVAGEVCI